MTENMAARGEGLAGLKLCPSCQATDNNAYTDANGVAMRACGRCMIQWRDLEAAAPAGTARKPWHFTIAEKSEVAGILLNMIYYKHGPASARDWVEGVINAIGAWRQAKLDDPNFYDANPKSSNNVRAALATLSLQAPPIESFVGNMPVITVTDGAPPNASPPSWQEQSKVFSTTSAREQSAATASSNLSAGDEVWIKSRVIAKHEVRGVLIRVDGVGEPIMLQTWVPAEHFDKLRAVTQEQPAGSGASEEKWFDAYHNQVKLTEELLRRQRLSILKGVQSKKNALSIARGVFDEHLAKAIAELEQEVSMTNVTGADNVSIPSLTKPESGEHGADLQSTSVTTSRRIEWFCQMCQKNHVAYCPVLDEEKFLHICDECGQSYQGSKHECPGSPRKVGEDGAPEKYERTHSRVWINAWNEAIEKVCGLVEVNGGELKFGPFSIGHNPKRVCQEHTMIVELIRALRLRPSSVPVGEQKQEEGV